MKNFRIIFLSLSLLAMQYSLCAAEGPTQFDMGAEFSYIQYREPDFMENKGNMYGVFGTVTHRISENQPVKSAADIFGTNQINAFKLDGRLSFGSVDYESQGTGTLDDILDFIFEIRGLAGYDIPLENGPRLTPYLGLGYRYLNDDSSGKRTTTGAAGYERESNYFYLPIGLEGLVNLNEGWSFGFVGEFDVFLMGRQVSHLSDAIAGLNDITNDQKSGYGLRGSMKLAKETESLTFFVEPFVRYWKVDDSEILAVTYSGVLVGFGLEPENNSTEYGARIGVNF